MELGICDQSNFVGTQGSRSFERQMARDPILLENNIYRALFHNCWNYLILKKLFVTLTCKVFSVIKKGPIIPPDHIPAKTLNLASSVHIFSQHFKQIIGKFKTFFGIRFFQTVYELGPIAFQSNVSNATQ